MLKKTLYIVLTLITVIAIGMTPFGGMDVINTNKIAVEVKSSFARTGSADSGESDGLKTEDKAVKKLPEGFWYKMNSIWHKMNSPIFYESLSLGSITN